MFLFQSTNVIICTCKLDLSRLCKEMGDCLTVHLSEELKNNKNENFNTLTSRKCKSEIEKVKETWKICGKPFGRDEKQQVSKRRMSLTPKSSLLCES